MMKVVKNEVTENTDNNLNIGDEMDKALNNPNKPTKEEIDAAEAEYSAAAEAFTKNKYAIGTPEESDDIFKFFFNYIENHVMWTKNGWMGVIRLQEEISALYEQYKEEPAVLPFELGYQALEFTMFMLSNPGGIGLKSAKAIEIVADLYIKIMEDCGQKLEEARIELKEIQFLYDKWTAMQQGFYLEREDGVEKPEPDQEEAASVNTTE